MSNDSTNPKAPPPSLGGGAAGTATPVTGTRAVIATDIRKHFGTVSALSGADLEIPCGKVTALVGDNGAGKSTLVKIISGVLQPDGGSLHLDQDPVSFDSPNVARRHGVHTVYQDLALADNLDVVENLFLGTELRSSLFGVKFPWIARGKMEAESRQLLRELGISTIQDLSQRIEMLSGGQRQTVAIARAVKDAASIVILDEPTAALGVVQSAQVMSNIRRVRDLGTGVLLVSHNLREVFEVSDRISVMRLGKVVEVFEKEAVDEEDVVSAIVGSRRRGDR